MECSNELMQYKEYCLGIVKGVVNLMCVNLNWTQQLFSENAICIKTLVIQKYMHTPKLTSCSQITRNDM